MFNIFVTRMVPEAGLTLLREKGCVLHVNEEDRVLTKEELMESLRGKAYDALFCLLTDKIDREVMEAAGPSLKIIANYAVGFDNIDIPAAKEKGLAVTNTPGVLTETVAEHTFALILAVAHKIAEADRFTREGQYHGWAPMLLLGTDVSHATLGIIGLGRIGSRVAHHAVHGFDMKVVYYDVARNEAFEKEFGATYVSLEDLLAQSDFVSIHVPLLPSTKHLLNRERLGLMKKTAYLVNTSRGPIIDEAALVTALTLRTIRGAALDVFENEPAVHPGLIGLSNVILTPHIASATEATRSKMSELAAQNIIDVIEGREARNAVK